jgi:hypothetical protein
MEDQIAEFLGNFDELATFDILLKLRAEGDPKFKVDFHVNFNQIELIARDMSQIKEYDFELVVFKFEANCFFTTKSLYHKLQETVSNAYYRDCIEFDNNEYQRVQDELL